MHTPADISQLAAAILGGTWAAERGPQGANGRLSAPDSGTFSLHIDDHGHLRLETGFSGPVVIARFPAPTTDDAERIARDVAQAIRQFLDKGEGEQESALYQEVNQGAQFSCADYSNPRTPYHPYVTIEGATCFFYIDEAYVAQVVVDLDSLTASGSRVWPDNAVPVRITLDGTVVFSSTGTWVFQFQHPEDGGDDGVWEYAIPAERAPTVETARAAATKQFLSDIDSHENADVWHASTIRSVQFKG
ncbi:hypothetical protein [Streptomyces tauricus]